MLVSAADACLSKLDGSSFKKQAMEHCYRQPCFKARSVLLGAVNLTVNTFVNELLKTRLALASVLAE